MIAGFSAATDATNALIVDSGASQTMVSKETHLDDVSQAKGIKIIFANGEETSELEQGSLNLKLSEGESLVLKDVLRGDKIAYNLISVKQLNKEHGLTVSFSPEGDTFIHRGDILIHKSKTKSLSGLPCFEAMVAEVTPCLLLHYRCGHPGSNASRKLVASGAVTGLPPSLPKNHRKAIPDCKACLEAKSKRRPFHSVPLYAKPSRRMHTVGWDVVEIKYRSVDGMKFLLNGIDEHNDYVFVCPMRNKTDASDTLRIRATTIMRELGLKPAYFRFDRG